MKNLQLFYNYEEDKFDILDLEEYLWERYSDNTWKKWYGWIVCDPRTMGMQEYLDQVAITKKIVT